MSVLLLLLLLLGAQEPDAADDLGGRDDDDEAEGREGDGGDEHAGAHPPWYADWSFGRTGRGLSGRGCFGQGCGGGGAEQEDGAEDVAGDRVGGVSGTVVD